MNELSKIMGREFDLLSQQIKKMQTGQCLLYQQSKIMGMEWYVLCQLGK